MRTLKELLGRFIWLTARAWGGEAACLPASWACSQVCCQASRSRTVFARCVLAEMQNVGKRKPVRPAVSLASGGATEPPTESQMPWLHLLVGRGSLCICGSRPGGSRPVGAWVRWFCPELPASPRGGSGRFSCCLRGPSCGPQGRLLDLGRDPQGRKLPLLSRGWSLLLWLLKGLVQEDGAQGRPSHPAPCSGCRVWCQPPPSCRQSGWGSSVLSGLRGPRQF